MTDEMAERTVVSVAALRGATERAMGRASRGWWGAAASEALVALFEELGLDAPAIYAGGRVEWPVGAGGATATAASGLPTEVPG